MDQHHQAAAQALAQLTAPGAPFELGTTADGLPCYLRAPATLPAALAPAQQYGDAEFLLYEGERYSFRQLLAWADEIRAALYAAGVGPGDRVAIAMRNYPEWMAIFIAVAMSGAVVVPVNSWGQPADILFALKDAGAVLAFCDPPRYQGIARRAAALGITLVIARPEPPDHPEGLAAFCAAAGAPPPVAAPDPDELAMIMYTSGTSGRPRGAASTHRALGQALYNLECAAAMAAMSNGEAIAAMLERGYPPTALLAVPLFHVSGCHAQFLVNLRAGRRMVMMVKWDVDRAIDCIERERVTTIAAAPTMLLDLLQAERFGRADTHSLFALGVGGAGTPARLAQLLDERVPGSFSGTGWGMTETNGQGASLTGDAFRARSGSAGLPQPIVQLQIRDATGQCLPAGSRGEVWIRSVACMREYWRRPDSNARCFSDGWLRSGDLGYLDEEGWLYLVDRLGDMILRGGENIYPAEVESRLLEIPGVREVAVVGIPHERLGQEVAAVVCLQRGEQLAPADLQAAARRLLPSYKVPTRWQILAASLPRNAANKLLRNALRAHFQKD